MKLLGSDDGPSPSLRFEYVPGGSIRDHLQRREYFSGNECRDILRQATSAIAHLHGLDPPISHRDINDNNILIQHRGAEGITVKLADLGVSKEGGQLHTTVGTPAFWPPEIFGEWAERSRTVEAYTTAVDIWGLGAVIAKLAGGQPQYTDAHKADNTLWCQDVCRQVRRRYQQRRDDLDRLLLQGMLCMDPKSCWHAQRCHEEAQRLPNGSPETWLTQAAAPWPSPDKEDEDSRDESGDDGSEAKTIRPMEYYHPNGEKYVVVQPVVKGVTAGVSDPVPLGCVADSPSTAASRSSDVSVPDASVPEPVQVQKVLDDNQDPENNLFPASASGGVSAFSENLRSTAAPVSGTVTLGGPTGGLAALPTLSFGNNGGRDTGPVLPDGLRSRGPRKRDR